LGSVVIPKNIKPVAFSIPEEKIVASLPVKKQLLASHIVDEEVAEKYSGPKQQKLFENEREYYRDLQESRFGITTKRAGWDCLRHYEIAANGAVICFKNLQEKPASCAPHGLIDGENCIAYSGYAELKNKIDQLPDETYQQLQHKSWEWAKENSTAKRVGWLLNENIEDITSGFFPKARE
jgi:hypothetical protein